MLQSGRFLGRLLQLLTKVGMPLMKNIIVLLTKCVLVPAASTADTGIHKKILVSGTAALIILNNEIAGIMKKVSQRFWPIDKTLYSNS